MLTSVDFTRAVTAIPTARPRSEADSDVMADVSTPPSVRSILTTVMAVPWSTDWIVPGRRLRMLTRPTGSAATLTSVDLISTCTGDPAARLRSVAASLVIAAVISGPLVRRVRTVVMAGPWGTGPRGGTERVRSAKWQPRP